MTWSVRGRPQRWGIPDFLSPSVDKKGPLDAFTVNGADFFYSVPNHNVRAIKNEMAHNATPSGQLRSVAPGWTFWAIESMIDELANAAGKDPAQYRIALLDGKGKNDGGAQRLRNTLLAAMGMAGYGTKQLPKGEGMGVACVSSQERATASWTACVAHVAVSPSRRGQGQEVDRGHRRRHAGASRQHPRPGRGCGAVGPVARDVSKRRR